MSSGLEAVECAACGVCSYCDAGLVLTDRCAGLYVRGGDAIADFVWFIGGGFVVIIEGYLGFHVFIGNFLGRLWRRWVIVGCEMWGLFGLLKVQGRG
ncbi:MAG: hypothetical protein ACT6FC_05140 [Methanosarcinaceae archaeon]